MAWALKGQSWWLIVVLAYLIGTLADHGLFVLIHDCCHQLLFKNRNANRWAAILANLPQIIPSAISFEKHHLKHHSHLGVPDHDADVPGKWEAKLISNYFFGKALWLLLFPVFQLTRLPRLKGTPLFDGWIVTNIVVQTVFTAAIWYLLGWHAIVYLFLSFFFSIGLHPLGARWVQEHYLILDSEQETFSYYGILNKLQFNIGFHNEHHDFPSIPWNRLPQVKKTAPEHYDTLYYHTSLVKLFFRFLFDQEISLFNRTIRIDRRKAAIKKSSTPDVELQEL
jgi:sphingolipid delta-4 desaturase